MQRTRSFNEKENLNRKSHKCFIIHRKCVLKNKLSDLKIWILKLRFGFNYQNNEKFMYLKRKPQKMDRNGLINRKVLKLSNLVRFWSGKMAIMAFTYSSSYILPHLDEKRIKSTEFPFHLFSEFQKCITFQSILLALKCNSNLVTYSKRNFTGIDMEMIFLLHLHWLQNSWNYLVI